MIPALTPYFFAHTHAHSKVQFRAVLEGGLWWSTPSRQLHKPPQWPGTPMRDPSQSQQGVVLSGGMAKQE